jgi:hypothetical protein
MHHPLLPAHLSRLELSCSGGVELCAELALLPSLRKLLIQPGL